jgi:hypothetical protein
MRDKNDKDFEWEYFKTSVDMGKAFKGIQGNYLLRAFFENLAKHADYELKLPFNKVSIVCIFLSLKSIFVFLRRLRE